MSPDIITDCENDETIMKRGWARVCIRVYSCVFFKS